MSDDAAANATSAAAKAREARAAAIEARLSGGGGGGAPGSSSGANAYQEEVRQKKALQDHTLKLRRIVDLNIRRDNGYEAAAQCLKLLDTLIGNILSHPTEIKYRSFKAENPRIAKQVLSAPGGPEFLLQAGFGTRTVDFKKEWYISDRVQPSAAAAASAVASPTSAESGEVTSTRTAESGSSNTSSSLAWQKLEAAGKVLRERLGESEWKAELERERKKREEEVEKNRVGRVLQEAEEDRERVALRVQRERRAREAAAATAASPTTDARRTSTSESTNADTSTDDAAGGIVPGDYTREVPFDAPSLRTVEAEDRDEDGGGEGSGDEGTGERPPPYGLDEWGTGRRLGSGGGGSTGGSA